MDVDDRRRYFIVGSVILEIVQPLFRTRLENDYSSKGMGSLQAFLSTLPVLHILFHLRHRKAYCCKDNRNCRNNSKLPLIYCQWDLLYTETPGQPGHNCHCKFTANPVQVNELDITLASLILLNCCHLGPSEKHAVRKLRRYKNDYLSHNTKGKINETEYKSLWTDLTNSVLQLDPNKQDDLIRIEKRPLDEGLCSRYSTDLLDIHKKLNEIGTHIQGISSGMQMMDPQIQGITSGMQMMGPQIQGITSSIQMMGSKIQGITSGIQELLSYQRNEAICQNSKKKLIEQGMDERKINPYKLGKTIFYLHHQIDLKSKLHVSFIGRITDVVMMDDGRLVICLCTMHRLLICNTDGLQVAIIPVKRRPCHLTPVNNTMVAVLLNKSFVSRRIEIYDINNKHKLQSIPINREGAFWDNTVIVVSTSSSLVIDDYQTEELVEFVETHCNQSLRKIHFSGDRIFYRDKDQSKHNLYWYSFTNDKLYTVTLPSIPFKMTTIQDGSLYVLCKDRSVQHISSNGKHFKSLKTNQSQGFSDCDRILYNSKQKKMFTLNISTGIAKILHEL